MSKNISFDVINKTIESIITKPVQEPAARQIIDEQGVFHTFPTYRDYLMFLDERDLELMARH